MFLGRDIRNGEEKTMKKVWKWFVFVLLITVGLAACGGHIPVKMHAPFARSVLATRSYRIIEKGISGKSCDFIILGVSTGNASYSAALADLHGKVEKKYQNKVKEYLLINQVEDMYIRWYLLAAYVCNIVTADVALLGDLAPSHIIASTKTKVSAPRLPAIPGSTPIVQDDNEDDSNPLGSITKKATGTLESGAIKTGEAADEKAEKMPRGEVAKPTAETKEPEEKKQPEVNVDDETKSKYRRLLDQARRYRAKGDFDIAVKIAFQARKVWFGGAKAQKLLGMMFLKAGHKKAAKKLYQEYLTLRPSAPDAPTIRRLIKYM